AAGSTGRGGAPFRWGGGSSLARAAMSRALDGRRHGSEGECIDRRSCVEVRPWSFEVEAALLINEGGVQCVPVVFARPLQRGARIELGKRPFLNEARVAALDPARAT